jgi:GTP-binding protein HflX
MEGLSALLDARLAARGAVYEIELPLSNGAALAWLHAHGKILKKSDTKTKSRITIRMGEADYGRFQNRFMKD